MRTPEDESIIFVPDSSHPGRFFPQISFSGTTRAFEPEDMARVLDYESVTQAPIDGTLMHGEDRGPEGLQFPMYHFCLRGGFLFYFDVEDVDEESGNYATYAAPPIGVVPLDKVTVEFPPGGRRVFREHAQTDARNGYELVILHTPPASYEGQIRPPSFLAAESLGQREKWTMALRSRADIGKPTLLRGGYSTMQRSAAAAAPPPPTTAAIKTPSAPEEPEEAAAASPATNGKDSSFADTQAEATAAATSTAAAAAAMSSRASKKTSAAKKREARMIQEQVMGVSDDAELANAVVEFGVSDFSEREWMANFFQIHNDFDAPAKCRQMEQFQIEMKKSLKGAVLEQYEYFVQASGEMTTMGREVSSLKTLIETQVEAMKEMKDIDFSGSLFEVGKVAEDKNESGVFEPPRLNRRRNKGNGKEVEQSFESEISSDESPDRVIQVDVVGVDESNMLDENHVPPIQVPEWLDDVEEEISSAVRECRYHDAIELLTKTKHELSDLLDKHERPTLYRLTKVQLLELQTIKKNIEGVGKRISERLEETLRRRNEALKQASKRERTDPSAVMAPIVSPCSLNDDGLYLQLLVKLGSTQQAAEAYSARRALLLLETLHEHPISGSGTVDLVIYAAQLSQSFFSCLASSVEGFLDLFLTSQSIPVNGDKHEEMSVGDSSLHSLSSKNAPAGAVSSIVLWCDAELSKFASAFGGTRILANLALSPPPRDGPRQPRVLGATEDANGSKERKNAIEVAAQCIDQAFLHASQNLDSVGLPLAPRLSEYIRVRLKGCEAEVAKLLDSRWQHLTIDWIPIGNGGQPALR
jgi:hypothetical protein